MAVLPRSIDSSRFDYTAPVTLAYLSSVISVDGFKLVDAFNGPIQFGLGGSTGRSITLSGGAITLSAPVVAGATITWTFNRTVILTETVSGNAYTQPGNGIEDYGLYDLATFTGRQADVDNQSDASGTDPGWDMIQTSHPSGASGVNGSYESQVKVLAASGYVKKLRVWLAINSAPTLVKGCVYDAAGNVLGTVVETNTGADVTPRYLDLDMVSSFFGTIGQAVRLAWAPNSGNVAWGYAAAVGSSVEYRAWPYVNFPEDPRVAGIPWTVATYDAGLFLSATP